MKLLHVYLVSLLLFVMACSANRAAQLPEPDYSQAPKLMSMKLYYYGELSFEKIESFNQPPYLIWHHLGYAENPIVVMEICQIRVGVVPLKISDYDAAVKRSVELATTLKQINEGFKKKGLSPCVLLQMVNAGQLPTI